MKNKSSVWLVCVLLCITAMGKAQVVTLENGFGISSMRYKGMGQIMDKIYPYQMSVGVQYMDKGWFNLSSNVGYLRQGERDKDIINHGWSDEACQVVGTNLHFLTVNTTFDLKKVSRDGYTCFIGVGPRIDYKIKSTNKLYYGDEDFRNRKADGYNSVLVGLKCVAGLRKDLGCIQLGFNFAYLPTFNRLNALNRNRTFTLGLSLGYKLGCSKDGTGIVRSVRRNK